MGQRLPDRRPRVNHPFYSLSSQSQFLVSTLTHPTPLCHKNSISSSLGLGEGSALSVVSVGNGNDRPTTMPLIFCDQQAPFGKYLLTARPRGEEMGRELCDCSVLPLFHSDGRSALPMTYLWSWARCVICERRREGGEKCSGGVMARNSGHYKRVGRAME